MRHIVEIRDATPADVEHVARNLRDADFLELSIAQPEDPRVAVRSCLDYSVWTKVVLVDGVPAVIYGVSPSDVEECGSPWMVGTDDIMKIPHQFVTGSRRELERMQSEFSFLYNQVHCKNKISISWLRWLGFSVDDERPTGPLNQFFNFWIGEPRHV